MKNRQLKNEHGLTLIEVLASLSIFAILIVLSSTLIMQLITSEEVSSSTSLQQNTNVLMAEIRNDYYKVNSPICFDDKKGLIDPVKSTFNNSVESLNISNGCIDVDRNKSLSIHLVTSNKGDNLTVETTLAKKDAYVLDLKENPDDFEEGNIDNCTFFNDTKFTSYIHTQNGNPGCNQYDFKKSAAFQNGLFLQNNSAVVIGGNLYVKGGLTVQPNSTVTVNGDFQVEGELDIKGQVCIKGEFKRKEQYYSQIDEVKNCFESGK
ncbi:PulJ/GspJ family protein [Virgibacillus sp. DJP39]|uniref:PulJ/GspJ family protein n=1 Tax=Virgibacillus sp. DJP39 TaxID=3409790 RepID=UPI003BB6BDDE